MWDAHQIISPEDLSSKSRPKSKVISQCTSCFFRRAMTSSMDAYEIRREGKLGSSWSYSGSNTASKCFESMYSTYNIYIYSVYTIQYMYCLFVCVWLYIHSLHYATLHYIILHCIHTCTWGWVKTQCPWWTAKKMEIIPLQMMHIIYIMFFVCIVVRISAYKTNETRWRQPTSFQTPIWNRSTWWLAPRWICFHWSLQKWIVFILIGHLGTPKRRMI